MTIATNRLGSYSSPTAVGSMARQSATVGVRIRCTYFAEPLNGLFREIVRGQWAAAEHDAANPQWHSFWFVVRKSDRTVVGSALFKALPDADGAVEIGYGSGKAFERHGYMTGNRGCPVRLGAAAGGCASHHRRKFLLPAPCSPFPVPRSPSPFPSYNLTPLPYRHSCLIYI